jgi:hypothetical protein
LCVYVRVQVCMHASLSKYVRVYVGVVDGGGWME